MDEETGMGYGPHDGQGWHHRKVHKILAIAFHVAVLVVFVTVGVLIVKRLRKRCRDRRHRASRFHGSGASGIPQSSPTVYADVEMPQQQSSVPVIPAPEPQSAPIQNAPSHARLEGSSIPYAAYYPVNQYPQVAQESVPPTHNSNVVNMPSGLYPAMANRLWRSGYAPVSQSDA